MNSDLGLVSHLQHQTDRIRNVCVLAHVDHGKTTLSDHLIASNGLIHPRLAGELRFLDSGEEEQIRGITMKSSSITLMHLAGERGGPRRQRTPANMRESGPWHLINLIDSPGHIDFCSEVSTAVRLSDGALVVVDAVEGVCIQTHAVLRQAWEERLDMVLVINKIDRLALELRLGPEEAYARLRAVVDHVNLVVSSFHSEQFISEADADDAGAEDVFSPSKGNVVFGSAGDGWAFGLADFAGLYAAKLGCKASALERALWGDYAFQPKTKRILPIRPGSGGKPLFVQFALEPLEAEERAMRECTPAGPPLVYISKMISVPANVLPRQPGTAPSADPSQEIFLAFGRVFAGTLRTGQALCVLPDTHNPADPAAIAAARSVTPSALYLMMGRGLEPLAAVPAGKAAPIVRVAVEPADAADLAALEAGLALLARADPMVRLEARASGERVLCAAGEVHLETCVKDLEARFARCRIIVSPPLVAFRESLAAPEDAEAAHTPAPGAQHAQHAHGPVVEAATPTGAVALRLRAFPLPSPLAGALEAGAAVLQAALGEAGRGAGPGEREREAAAELGRRLAASAEGAELLLARAWALGPRRVGPNALLLSPTSPGQGAGGPTTGLWDVPPPGVLAVGGRQGRGARPPSPAGVGPAAAGAAPAEGAGADEAVEEARATLRIALGRPEVAQVLCLGQGGAHAGNAEVDAQGTALGLSAEGVARLRDSIEAGVLAGFGMATEAGPLCDEPMWGVGFEVEARVVGSGDEASPAPRTGEDVYGPLSGQIATSSEGLSAVYAVLGRRRARVLREELREGSDLFMVHAYLPAESSFGFVDELRRRSSGAASASLLLSHWERLGVDPFFVPTSLLEREEWGEEGQGVGAANLARKLIDATRRRKGLPVEEKVVESATKQRTRARKV
ncbi:Elongation factor 2 [Auxenochlorella protothecoides]|uniref:Elongation factor 2 n=1 Tax=Auxenochlorella protothecoides TaxID=3075 RepID=A0A087SJY5_AUXPR|nr:Elongation factor 2 [Auxenochlorella protothecoides]KFM26039.1 Elongation factor 2 [Auxenochlorella protothecoides]